MNILSGFLTIISLVVFVSLISCTQGQNKANVENMPEVKTEPQKDDGKLKKTKFEELSLKNGKTLNYAIHLPENFDGGKKYPAIIGPGEGTEKDSPSYYWHGNPSEHGWIIVESMAHLGDEPVETTKQLLDHISSNYNIEGNKFHMVGYSANSAGSFSVGMALANRFHSLTGVAGYPRKNPDKKDFERLKHLKFYFIVGDQDQFWMDASKKAHEHLKSIGLKSHLEIIKDGKHVLKKIDGKPFMKLMEKMR